MLTTWSHFSFWFALALSVGSLFFYLTSAIWNRITYGATERDSATYEFNLGLPDAQNVEDVFAITLVTAGTSLSTVLVFFLTAGVIYGWWLLLCPFAFAIGNWIMFIIYSKNYNKGYFDEMPAWPSTNFGLMDEERRGFGIYPG